MKKGFRTAIAVGIVCLLAVGFFFIWKMNGSRRLQTTCRGVNVEFADSLNFVTKADIEGYLKNDYGPYIGQRLDSVRLDKVESIIEKKSSILKVDAYTTPDGYLNIKVYQREPAIRFLKGENGFYADDQGFVFPLQSDYTSDVMQIEGNIPLTVENGFKGELKDEKQKEWLMEAIDLVNYMKGSGEWDKVFTRMVVNEEGDIVMYPREGNEKFVFGKPVDIEAKFGKIKDYYTAVVPAKGKDYYKTVNVKYKGQLVCRQK